MIYRQLCFNIVQESKQYFDFFSSKTCILESAKSKIDIFEEAENELKEIEKGLQCAETVHPSFKSLVLYLFFAVRKLKFSVLFQEKNHYEGVMKDKVLADIKVAEAKYKELEAKRLVRIK